MTTRVLLTGASGFLGGHLLRQLRAEGVGVAALCRSDSAAAQARAMDAEPVRGDVRDVESLRAAMAPPTAAVFHVAADTNMWRARNAEQMRINVDGTRNVVQAARERAVGRLVHTSSVATFGQVDDVLVETLPRRGLESWINYERTKARAELIVREAATRGEIDAVILNPAHILGPGDRHNWARLFVLIARGKLPGAPPGSGAFADVREVARAHIAAWRKGQRGESYLLGGEHASFLELVRRIAALLGKPAPRRALPGTVLRIYARVLEAWSLITRREPELTPESVSFTCHHMRVDSARAQRELGYAITPLDTLLADTCTWLREQGMVARV